MRRCAPCGGLGHHQERCGRLDQATPGSNRPGAHAIRTSGGVLGAGSLELGARHLNICETDSQETVLQGAKPYVCSEVHFISFFSCFFFLIHIERVCTQFDPPLLSFTNVLSIHVDRCLMLRGAIWYAIHKTPCPASSPGGDGDAPRQNHADEADRGEEGVQRAGAVRRLGPEDPEVGKGGHDQPEWD